MLGLFKPQSEQGLIYHWPLNETSGLVANERKGKGDGALTNMVGDEWVSGKIGGSLGLDATDDYVDVSSISAKLPLGNSPRTIVGWALRISSSRTIFSYGTNAAGQAFECRIAGANISIRFSAHNWSGNVTIPAGFNHVAYVVPEGATMTDDCLLYFNGSILSGATTSGSPQTLNTVDNAEAFLGRGLTGSFFNGDIDDFRVYNRGLSADEIAGLALLGI